MRQKRSDHWFMPVARLKSLQRQSKPSLGHVADITTSVKPSLVRWR